MSTLEQSSLPGACASAEAPLASRLRIALVTPMLPVPHDQTRGRYIHETARSLAKLATVRVFFQQIRYPDIPLLAPRSYLYGRLDSDYRIEGIDVEPFEYLALPGLTRPFNSSLSARALRPRLRAFHPDVVLAYWVYPDGHAALIAARQLGVPCVVGALGSDIHVRDGLNAWFTRRTIAGVDALLTVSEDMRRSAIRTFGAEPTKVHTIVNGFNTQIFHARARAPLRVKFSLPDDARVIVYVGRFVEAKGLNELLSVFCAMAAQDPKLRLALIGDGVMRNELTVKVAASGFAERVTITGGLAPETVAEWICASDVLCLPSWSEGYPNVVVEAVACGRPVVATDVGGTREILDASRGILIAPRDVTSLRDGLTRALATNWNHEAIAAAIRRSWDDVAKETLVVCEQAVASLSAKGGRGSPQP